MDYLRILILTLHLTQVLTKSKRKSKRQKLSSDDDSIENLLYYKDCQRQGHQSTSESPELIQTEFYAPPTPPIVTARTDCAFPKMCCAMTCGTDCNTNQNFIERQMEPAQSMQQLQPIMPPDRQLRQAPPMGNMGGMNGMGSMSGMGPVQPQIVQRRKKKLKFPPNKMPPMMGPGPGTRRDYGATKEKIKTLISQDNDIRKILKELVRVTMQKVDLVDKIKSRISGVVSVTPPVRFDDYVD